MLLSSTWCAARSHHPGDSSRPRSGCAVVSKQVLMQRESIIGAAVRVKLVHIYVQIASTQLVGRPSHLGGNFSGVCTASLQNDSFFFPAIHFIKQKAWTNRSWERR